METKEPNVWQITAEKTKDIVTPANMLTVGGLALTLQGAKDLRSPRGFTKLLVGRVADAFDGAIARATGTDTKLGELLDAGADKVATAGVLIQAYRQNIMPRWSIGYMGAQNIANVGLSMAARARGIEMHSSKAGKVNTAIQSGAFFAYSAAEMLRTREAEDMGETVKKIGDALTIASVGLGIIATAGYANEVRTGKNL